MDGTKEIKREVVPSEKSEKKAIVIIVKRIISLSLIDYDATATLFFYDVICYICHDIV